MLQRLEYQFKVHLEKIYVDISLPCNLIIRWKKSNKKAQSQPIKITDRIQFKQINQTVEILARCKVSNGHFLPQQARVQVLLFPIGCQDTKIAGQIQKFDLTQALLFDRRRQNTQKKFDVPLFKSTKNARLIFTIYSRFVKECLNEESMDVSFTGKSNGSFFANTQDMTFRPSSEKKYHSREKDHSQDEVKSPLMPPKNQYKQPNRDQRINSRQENRDYNRRDSERQTRNQYQVETPVPKDQIPMNFSFGPQSQPHYTEKQMKELLNNLNDKSHELSLKKQECQRLQNNLRALQNERGGIDQRKLQLINELNSSITQSDNLKKQKSQMQNQLSKAKEDLRQMQANYSQLKEDNRDLISNFNRLRQETSRQNSDQARQNNENASLIVELKKQLEERNREFDTLNNEFEKVIREREQNKNKLFKKQSELINCQNHIEEIKAQYLNKSIPIMEELKRVNQDLGKQRSDLQQALHKTIDELNYEKEQKAETEKRTSQAFEELEKERQKIKKLVIAFEEKQKSNKVHLSAIEEEMKNFFAEKDQQIRLKQQSIRERESLINELKTKLNEEQSKREEEGRKNTDVGKQFEANLIQISELKVKIKHLEEAYSNLEKDYEDRLKQLGEKSKFIEEVREYVTKIEQDNRQKDILIKERDEFIAKAKQFITGRQKQLLSEVERLKSESVGMQKAQIEKMNAQIRNMTVQGNKREGFIAQIVQESNVLQQRLDQAEGMREEVERRSGQLQQYIGHLHQKMEQMQEQMEQLVRKTRSQEQTLQDLVKNKLDMEIQLNVCKFELQSLKNH